jgi:hypothetical protein
MPALLTHLKGIPRGRLVLAALAVLILFCCFRTTVRGDGVGYYSYLPTVVAHGSLDVGPTFDQFIAGDTPLNPFFLQITLPNGMTANFKPVGSALMALPFYAVTHVLLVAVVPGYQNPDVGTEYQLAFTAASLFFVLLALVLIYGFVRSLWGARVAVLATIGAIFATPVINYIVFEASYSHDFTIFATTAFALYLYRTREHRRPHQWLIAGAFGGLATITHSQEILFLALVPMEAVWQIWQRRWNAGLISGYAFFLTGVLALGLPQLVMGRVMFQHWLPQAAPNIFFDFLHPHLGDMLFSTRHGWLSWSPLVALSFLGIPAVVRRLQWLGAGLVVIALGELYLNASLSDWWGGAAFGARRLTDQTLLVALGLGAVFAWLLERRIHRLAYAALAAGIGWTVLLLGTFYYIIANDTGPTWRDFLVDQLHAPLFTPRLLIQGTVVRELATGDVVRGLYTALVIVAVLGAALWLGAKISVASWRESRPPGSPPQTGPPGLIWEPVSATQALP